MEYQVKYMKAGEVAKPGAPQVFIFVEAENPVAALNAAQVQMAELAAGEFVAVNYFNMQEGLVAL